MSLVNFEVIYSCITTRQVLMALEKVIPSQTITSAISSTNSQGKRQRILPTQVVVALVIAMSFWSSYSIVDVFKNLIHGFSSLQIKEGIRFKAPTSSSITEARQRIGPAVMTRLFEMVAKPLATFLTPGAFLGGLRIMAVDGTVFDIPDTEEDGKSFWLTRLSSRYISSLPKSKISFFSRSRNSCK